MMLKFDNTPAVWPRFPVVMPSFTTQPVLFYSMLPNQQNCCHLPHILPIAFRLAGKMLPKSNTILPLPWFKRACATQTGTVTAAALRTSSVSLMWPFDTHHFVPDVQGVVFLYSFCATRFQTILFPYPTKYRDPSSFRNAPALCPISSNHLYGHYAPILRWYRLIFCVATE